MLIIHINLQTDRRTKRIANNNTKGADRKALNIGSNERYELLQ